MCFVTAPHMTLLLLLLLVLPLLTEAFKFSPQPSTDYVVEPGYESCSGFVGFVNMPIHQVLNGQEDLHLNHMIFIRHSRSFCFNGIVETLTGVIKTRPFRVSFDQSRHTTRLLSKSERHVKTVAREIHFRRVEDHYYDVEVDTRELIVDAHRDHPDCLAINIREVDNAIGKDIIIQCITSEAPDERVWLLQTNQEGYEHQFHLSMERPDAEKVNLTSMSLGKNLDMQWHLDELRIGYIAYRGFVQANALKPFLILSPDKKKLLEYKGANRPWEQQQTSPFAYAPNPTAEVIYDQTKIMHGADDHFHVLKNDPNEYEEARMNSFVFDSGYRVESTSSADDQVQLVGYNMNKEIALTVESKSRIESVIVNKGVIQGIECTLDESNRFIKCTVDSAGKPGPCQLLLFGVPLANVDDEEPLAFHSINTAKTHIIIMPVFGLGIDVNNTENPHVQRTFTVCTIYKLCKELSFEQTWLLPPFEYNGSIGKVIKPPGVSWNEFWKHVWDSVREEVGDRTNNIKKNGTSIFDKLLYIFLWGVLPLLVLLLVGWSLVMLLLNKCL